MLALFLVLLAPDSVTLRAAADAHEASGQHLAAATAYLDLADAAGLTAADRVGVLGRAHDNLYAAWLSAPDHTQHLCRALTLAESVVRDARFRDEHQRLYWVDTVALDRKGLRDGAMKFARPNCRFDAAGQPLARGRSRPAVAERSPKDARRTTPAQPVLLDPPTSDPADEPLLAVRTAPSSPGRERPRDATLPPPAPERLARPEHPARPALPSGGGLLIAGGLSLGAATVFGALAGWSVVRHEELERRIDQVRSTAQAQGYTAPEVTALRDALGADADRIRNISLSTAIVAGATATVGAVLIGVGARRRGVARRFALTPAWRGLWVVAHF